MNKITGLCTLAAINGSLIYLIYWYAYIVSSTKIDNFLHVPFEPSGMQLIFYFISLPMFILVGIGSHFHAAYYGLKKSLVSGIALTWLSYCTLILFIYYVVTFPRGNVFLYYGTLVISLAAILHIVYLTYYQFICWKALTSSFYLSRNS